VCIAEILKKCEYHLECTIDCAADLLHAATHCNTLQHTAWHCSTLQHTATHCNTPEHTGDSRASTESVALKWAFLGVFVDFFAADLHPKRGLQVYKNSFASCQLRLTCYTLQHTATHCNTLQHIVWHCMIQQHTITHYNTLQYTATHRNTQGVKCFNWKRGVEESISVGFGDFFDAELPGCIQKQGFEYTRIRSLLVNWCCHSVEPRALTCPFKQSDLSAWSLMSWHPTLAYTPLRLRETLCVFKVVFCSPSRSCRVTRIM